MAQSAAPKDYNLPELVCQRCRHAWQPRSPYKPLRCASCGSPYWERPRQAKKKKGVA